MKNFCLFILIFISHFSFSQNFTDTKGELQISASGTATYTLPIATPPSIKNVVPIINLVYSSGVRGGIAGQGWSINSISAISRIATRRDIDSFVDGVDFDDNDKLALDGQRLLLKTGTYWAPGSTYETEYKSNTKIELQQEGAVMYFIVTTPDGSRSWYGSKGSGSLQNSVSLNSWYIVHYEDVNGNFIDYNYKTIAYNSSNQLYIDTITFSGNATAGIAAQDKIAFNYRSSKRIEKDYLKGVAVYATQILENIQVYANNTIFRTYKITHGTDDLGYERVSSIKEVNAQNEESNPVVFNYDTTATTTTRTVKDYTNNLQFDTVDLGGDFDGDGNLDFVADNKVFTKLFESTSGNAPIDLPTSDSQRGGFAVTTVTNGKLNQFQSILTSPYSSINNLEFRIYNLKNNYFENSYTKNLSISDMPANYVGPLTTILEGDYNGDGISEILFMRLAQDYICYFDPNPYAYNPPCNPTSKMTLGLVDLNPASSTIEGSPGYIRFSETSYVKDLMFAKCFVSDFNGDGKSDILAIHNPGAYNSVSNKTYKIYSFKQLPYAPWVEVEIIGEGIIDAYSKTKQQLLGDFNGDGKTDLMLPESEGGEGQVQWHIYYANPKLGGGEFFTKESHNIVEYRPDSSKDSDPFKTQVHVSNYYAIDVNKDGKSDLVRVWRKYYKPQWTINDHDTKWKVTAFTNTIGKVGASGFTQTYDSNEFYSGSPEIPIPIVSNYRYNGANTDVVIVRGHSKNVEYYQFNKNFDKDNRLKLVTEADGKIKQSIDYLPMEAANYSLGNSSTDFYSSADGVAYPNIEIIRNSGSYLVSKLTATINGVSKFQDFRYRGYISNFNYGTVGFTRTTRSGWYLSESDTKIWTTQHNDVNLRGANTITWSSTSGTTVFDGTPSNLLSTKTNVFSGYTKGGGDAVSSGTIPDVINITDPVVAGQTYKAGSSITASSKVNDDVAVVYQAPQITLKPGFTASSSNNTKFIATPTAVQGDSNAPVSNNSVFNVLLTKQTTVDHLSGVKSETVFSYDGISDSPSYYGLETRNVTKKYSGSTLQGTTTVDTEYDNNPTGVGSTYYVGRPKKINSSTTIYSGDTRTSEEAYTYSGSNVTRTEKKGTGTYAVIEDVTYDAVGNVLTKTVSAPGASSPVAARTITDEYDSTKRFVVKKTDHQGFVTNFAYNALGQVTKSTDYLGVVNDYVYDNWGKLINTTTQNTSATLLTTAITYTKLADGGYTTTTTTNTDGKTIIQHDVLGRVVVTTTKGFTSGTMVSKQIVYDGLGRKTKESEPYFSSPSQWTVYEYDYLMRPEKITSHTYKVQSFSYAGLTTTSNDDGKITTATVDALGNKTQTTDPGGAVNFIYYANGQLKESDYQGNKVSISIDGWGNKIAMTDPSAGTYTYSYDDFGQIKTETTPNGTINYKYDDAGKITEKTIVGTQTNSKTTYAYNALNFITSSSFVNNKEGTVITNSFEYDPYNRVSKTIENTPYAVFTKELTYDTYGRALTEISTAAIAGKSSAKKIKHTYQNGFAWQILDDATQQVLWQTNSLNERGKLKNASLGNGIGIDNLYDEYGYASQFKWDRTVNNPGNVMTLTTVFEPKRGNLNYRANNLFGWAENFTYDELDRLLTYNDAWSQQQTQTYDSKGKITQNNLGTYNYTVTGKTYQNNSITLSPAALSYYQNRGSGANTSPKLNLDIVYNTFKSPVSIKEKGRDGNYVDYLSFSYNDGNDRSTMFYGGPQEDKLLRPLRKHYSGDGTMEIKENRTTGIVEFVTYIGGDGYSAPLVVKSDGTVQNYLYLHRDYQGTILAVTDNSGAIVEKRLFDAWGALLKVQNGAGTDLGTLTVLDRGYTGHEHLQSVGIINMNGRLYDPKMHRFMQPDNFIQDPSNTQNYNRYGYVLNNPLKYTDPSGEYAEIGFLAAVGIGAAIAALSYTMTALLADVPFSVGGLLKSTFIGAASAAVTFGIGTAASSIFSTPAMGFWQGAYQGAVVGSITGAGGSVVNKVFTGESITLKAILGGAVTGGIVGGAVGGIQGGLRAESLDSEFWSGKKWQEIKIGYGTKNLFSSKVNFSDTRWDIDQQMNIAQTNQNFDFDCTHACKLSVDSYYNVSGQESNNLKWLNQANTLDANGVGGIKNVRLMGMYEGTGYSTNPLGNGYFQSYSARVSLPWMSNEMSQNRIIQIGWKPDGTLGHASLVTRLRYLSDFSRYRIDIMNPNSGGTTELRSFSKIHQIFSLWKR